LFHGSICFGSSRLVRAPCSVFGLPVHKSKGAADFRSQFSVRASVAVLPCRLVLRFSVRSSAVKFWFDLFVSSAKVRFSSCAQDSLAFSWLPPIVRVAAALADTRVRVVNRTCVHNADAILLSSDFSHLLHQDLIPSSRRQWHLFLDGQEQKHWVLLKVSFGSSKSSILCGFLCGLLHELIPIMFLSRRIIGLEAS
jgi:hypothetical protein